MRENDQWQTREINRRNIVLHIILKRYNIIEYCGVCRRQRRRRRRQQRERAQERRPSLFGRVPAVVSPAVNSINKNNVGVLPTGPAVLFYIIARVRHHHHRCTCVTEYFRQILYTKITREICLSRQKTTRTRCVLRAVAARHARLVSTRIFLLPLWRRTQTSLETVFLPSSNPCVIFCGEK